MGTKLKRLASFGLAVGVATTMAGCAREVESEQLPLESSIPAISNEINERDYIYDESGMFLAPLSMYSFKYFPKTYRTDVDLMTVLDAYGMSYADFMDKFVRVIYAAGGANNYETAYDLTTFVLNRFICCGAPWGDDLISIITNGQQFSCYANGSYKEFEVDGLEDFAGYQGIFDCLVNFSEDQTNRMHNGISYQTYIVGVSSDYTFTEFVNHPTVLLQEDQIAYRDITLNNARN